MRPVQDFEVSVPRGAEVIAREAGIPDVSGVAIGIKWSKETGWWIEVRDNDGIVRSYRAEQVEVIEEIDGSGYARSGEGDWN